MQIQEEVNPVRKSEAFDPTVSSHQPFQGAGFSKGVKSWLPQPYKIFFWEAFLFFLTLILGIFTAVKLNKVLEIEEISPPSISFWQFLLYFFLVTLFVLFLSYFVKFKPGKNLIFKAIFIFAVFWGGLLTLSLWISEIVSLVLMTILVFWWLKKPSIFLHNLSIILGIAGMAGFLGLRLNPLTVVLFLIVFSIYDFLAIYKTKHMVKMAKAMIESRAILALICPSKVSDFRASLEEVAPGGKFLILGGGDVAFPLLLAVSLVPEGIFQALIVAIFSLIGLFFSFWFFISQKTRQPIPALPPIAFFSIIGYLITKAL